MTHKRGWLVDSMASFLSGTLSGTVARIAKEQGIPVEDLPSPEAWADGVGSEVTTKLLSWIGATVGSPLGFFPVLGTYYNAGLAQIHGQEALMAYLPSRIPPREFITMAFRGQVTEENLPNWLRELGEQGWSPERIDTLREAARPIFGGSEIRDLYLRGEFGTGDEATTEAHRRLTMNGYTDDDADLLIRLFFYIPPVSDLVRMVVREAWRDDIAAQFGTDDQLDQLPFSEFAKAGVSPEWLKRYWRAHWELPPMSQAFEMFHRDIIDKDVLETLMRTQDVMPYWRDKITAVAYNPLTRVDVRRMYRLRVLERDGVLRAYQDIGYSPENAELMTQFTEKYENRDDLDKTDEYRDLTRSMIVTGYREALIDRERALGELAALEYSDDDAEFILALEDARTAESELKAELGFVGRAYVSGSMTREDMIDRLGALNMSGDRTEYYTQKWDRDRINKSTRPSVADFRRWFKQDLISRGQFDEEMTVEGYSSDYIDLYASEVTE